MMSSVVDILCCLNRSADFENLVLFPPLYLPCLPPPLHLFLLPYPPFSSLLFLLAPPPLSSLLFLLAPFPPSPSYLLSLPSLIILLTFLFPSQAEASFGPQLSALCEVRCLVCSYLHQMFIAEPSMVKLVHFQGYPLQLLPMMVSGVPSMHICLDFIPELLAQPETHKQVGTHVYKTTTTICGHIDIVTL